jgi:LacI family transcriptional regulator
VAADEWEELSIEAESMKKVVHDRSATLKDVARAAGVSSMTVSNFVNGRLGEMSRETRERVEQEIKRLNYRPSTSARSLRRSERLSIGLVIVDESPAYLTHPAHSHLLAGLSNFLSERGYSLSLQGARPGNLSDALIVQPGDMGDSCRRAAPRPARSGTRSAVGRI